MSYTKIEVLTLQSDQVQKRSQDTFTWMATLESRGTSGTTIRPLLPPHTNNIQDTKK